MVSWFLTPLLTIRLEVASPKVVLRAMLFPNLIFLQQQFNTKQREHHLELALQPQKMHRILCNIQDRGALQ